MKLTNTTRVSIDIAMKTKDGSVAYESIPSGETRTITAVDKDHALYVAHVACGNLIEGKVSADSFPADTGTGVADVKGSGTKA